MPDATPRELEDAREAYGDLKNVVYPLSCYGPRTTRNLVQGDLSPEEWRYNARRDPQGTELDVQQRRRNIEAQWKALLAPKTQTAAAPVADVGTRLLQAAAGGAGGGGPGTWPEVDTAPEPLHESAYFGYEIGNVPEIPPAIEVHVDYLQPQQPKTTGPFGGTSSASSSSSSSVFGPSSSSGNNRAFGLGGPPMTQQSSGFASPFS